MGRGQFLIVHLGCRHQGNFGIRWLSLLCMRSLVFYLSDLFCSFSQYLRLVSCQVRVQAMFILCLETLLKLDFDHLLDLCTVFGLCSFSNEIPSTKKKVHKCSVIAEFCTNKNCKKTHNGLCTGLLKFQSTVWFGVRKTRK